MSGYVQALPGATMLMHWDLFGLVVLALFYPWRLFLDVASLDEGTLKMLYDYNDLLLEVRAGCTSFASFGFATRVLQVHFV